MDKNRAREEAKDRLRGYLPDYLRMMGINIGTNGKKPFLCLNPSHNEKTPSMSYDEKRERVHCFGCSASYDIFDLIGINEGIHDFNEQLKRAGELFNIDIGGRPTAQEDFRPASRSASPVAQNQPRNERPEDVHIHIDTYTHTDTQKEDYTEYYKECNARLSQIDYLQGRGISEELANRFTLGYDPSYRAYSKEREKWEDWKVLIIPTSPRCYVARNLDPNADSRDRYRNTKGEYDIFNLQALQTAQKPIVITEGEVDALSIIEAGGEAIGLGSASNVNKQLKALEKVSPTEYPFIIALDNDEAGHKATDTLVNGLRTQGKKAYIVNLYGDYKDANEALQKDRDSFTRAIAEAESTVVDIEREALESEKEEYLEQSTAGHLQDFINGIAESVNTPAQTTGFPDLDKVLDGGLFAGLYFIGAISSLGKTTLALQIADQVADSGQDVLIFSLEMARSELMSKSISRQTIIDVQDNNGDPRNAKTTRGITAGERWANYSQTEKDLIQRAITAYGDYAQHIYIQEGIGDIGTAEVRRTVEKHERLTGKTPVVLIDYVQILAQPETKKSLTDKQAVDKNVLELKRISRDHKTPIICISSFNRDNYYAPVNLASFKESGAIEYSSDVLIGLQYEGMDYRDGEKDGDRQKRIRKLLKDMEERGKRGESQTIQLKVLKHRNGSRGEVFFDYYPVFNYFKEK